MKIRISWVGRQSTDVKSTTDINWCSLWEIRYVYHFNISTNLPKHPITGNPIANILLEVYYFNTEVIHRRYFSNRDKLRYTEIYWCPGEIYWDILMPWCSSMMLDGTSVVLVKSQIQGSNQSSQSTVWLELESTVWWIVGSSASRSGSQDHKVRPKEWWRLWSEVMTTTMIFTSAHHSVNTSCNLH